MAKASDKITPAKLRADGWVKSNQYEWRQAIGRACNCYLTVGGTFGVAMCDIRTVTGMSDLRRLVSALMGDSDGAA